MKAYFAGDFEAAFDLLLFQMGRSVFTFGYNADALDITVRETADRPTTRMNDAEFENWSPGEAMLADRSGLSLDWLDIDDDGESFTTLRALSSTLLSSQPPTHPSPAPQPRTPRLVGRSHSAHAGRGTPGSPPPTSHSWLADGGPSTHFDIGDSACVAASGAQSSLTPRPTAPFPPLRSTCR